MKIFLIGEMPYGQAGWSFKKTFEKLGYQVECYDNFIYLLPQNKWIGIFSKIAGGFNLLLNIFRVNFLFPWNRLKKFNPDIILVLKGINFFPKTIRKIKSMFGSSKLVNRNADNPFADYNTSMGYLKSIKYYDFHITFGKYIAKILETVGAKNVIWIPFWHDEILMPSNIEFNYLDIEKYICDILFVGTYDSKRELVLSWICDKYNVKIFGNDWNRCKNEIVRKCVQSKAIYGSEVSKAFKIASINLNILRIQNKYSHNMRNMEVPGTGGLLLTEYSDEIQELFKNNPYVYTWKTKEELIEKIEYILSLGKINVKKDDRFELNNIVKKFLYKLNN